MWCSLFCRTIIPPGISDFIKLSDKCQTSYNNIVEGVKSMTCLMCTQSVDPTQPGNPNLSYTFVTFLISSSVSGDLQYVENNSVEKFLQNEWKKTRMASSLMFVSSAMPSKHIPRPRTRRTPRIFSSRGADGLPIPSVSLYHIFSRVRLTICWKIG